MDRYSHDSLALVVEHCPDDASVLALSVARTVAAGYMTGDVACWDLAYSAAEDILGARDGGAFVAAVTGVVRAIRAERQGDWAFLPATCCRLTPHEQRFVAALQQARGADSGTVPLLATGLAQAPEAPRLTDALLHAGAVLERVKAGIRVPAPAPRRRAGGVCPVVH